MEERQAQEVRGGEKAVSLGEREGGLEKKKVANNSDWSKPIRERVKVEGPQVSSVRLYGSGGQQGVEKGGRLGHQSEGSVLSLSHWGFREERNVTLIRAIPGKYFKNLDAGG